MTNLTAAMVLLAVCGVAMTSFLQSINHHLQLSCGSEDRTHIIAVYTTIVQGVTPPAALAVAFFAHQVGVRPVLTAGGLAVLSVVGAMFLEQRRARR
ncbi:hypothetical protein [Nocardia africana]|uniref:Major Facilitator Superfamily n=1 Tax=Nocardia africana TaxID=134964 RepID=A0ABW6NCJ7_9NOCA